MKRYIVSIFFIAITLLMLTSTAIGADYLYRVAVLPFDDGSIKEKWWGENDLGQGVADELVTALMGTKRFRLFEREEIDAVLKEQNLGKKGLLDPKTAARIGKILGVQYLVIGRVTEFTRKTDNSILGNPNADNPMGMYIRTATARVALDARLVDTTTAEILTSVTGTGEKKNIILGTATKQGLMVFGSTDFKKSDMGRALRVAVNSVAYQLANKAYDGVMIPAVNINGKIAYAGPTRIIINIGKNDGVEEGMVFTVRRLVDLVTEPGTDVVVDEVTEPIAEIVVTKVKERTADCTIKSKLNSNYEIEIADRVQTKEPVPVAALPPLEYKDEESANVKRNSGKIFCDFAYFIECQNEDLFEDDKNNGYMSMIGGEYTFGRIKVGAEHVITGRINDGDGKVDIAEYKVAYDLNNDSDYKMELFLSSLDLDWNYGTVENNSYMFGADVGWEPAEKMYVEASFGYGINPSTKVNGKKDRHQTNITTVKVKVNYAVSEKVDVYAGYRSYLIARKEDQNLTGIVGGIAFKF